jgi:hypothetical protein
MSTTPPRRPHWHALLLLILASGVSCPAFAQTESERIKELERRLEKSLQLIEQLSNRVNELEKGQAPAARAPAPPPAKPDAQEARIEALEKNVGQMASGHGAHDEGGGIPVHGFADAGYEYSTRPRDDNRKAGFVLGNLDFFFTPNFDRVKMLAELNFEVGEAGDLSTDLERLQFGYTFSDALTGWIGRFHTPYGYWNAAFHHGAQIQTVTRPRFVEFEDRGGILPAHTVGLWANGRYPLGPGRIVYDAWLGNGNRIVDGVLDFQAHRDEDANKEVGANVGYRFGGPLDGLLLGIHGLREDVAAHAGGVLLNRTSMGFTGAYFYYDSPEWEAIGEYYRFRNRDLSGGTGTHGSWAAFVQVGRTIFDVWTPYYRWEKAALDQSDNYFASQESGRAYQRHVLGIKYLLNPNTALKLEANRTREVIGEEKSYNEARAQFAVRF